MALRERLITVDERRNVAWKQASDLIELAAGEARSLTAEEQTQYDGLVGEVDTLGREREQLAAHEARARTLEAPRREIRLLPGGDRVVGPSRGRAVDTEEYHDAFRAYIRGGEKRMNAEQIDILARGYQPLGAEERALTVTTTAGGYLIPQGFEDTLTLARLQFGGMRQANTRKMMTDTGNDWPIPGMDDTGNKGMLLTINTGSSTQDVAFTQRTLKAYVMHSKSVKVPWQLQQDSAFDVEGVILAPAFGERIGRIENDYFTTGAGSTEPQGIVTAATTAITGGATAAAGPTYAEYVAMYHSVDPAYRMTAQWLMNDNTVSLARQIVDLNGRPIWLPAATGGLQSDAPDILLGRQVIVNQSMASCATVSDYPIVFGDLTTFWIRDVRGITVVRQDELYSDALQTGYFAYARVDSILVDAGTHPVKRFRSHAS